MKHILFGVPVDDFSTEELKNLLILWLRTNTAKIITTPNPEFILLANKQPAFKQLLVDSDLSVADGVGLRFAISALTQGYLKHRQTGVDLVELLCRLAHQEHKSVLFLGGEPQMAERAKNSLQTQFPDLLIEAVDPGVLVGNASHVEIPKELIETIRAISPDVLMVGLGQGKQERFMNEMKSMVPSIKILIGVGGSFETIAGIKPRAPERFRKSGFEWLWRLWIEPKRFHRIFQASLVFPTVVLFATLKQKSFLKALKRTIPEIWKQLTNKS